MTKPVSYRVLGVMSGTSLDGIDLAMVKFFKNKQWTYQITVAETLEYPDEWIQNLKTEHTLSTTELHALNVAYTEFLAHQIQDFLGKHSLQDIDFISSHGHTVLHQPQSGITLQIGNLPQLAQRTKQKVVCDFRKQDVALGGQGAPLVPIGDQLLFADYEYCLNLGGFTNLSYQENHHRVAYDICPLNTVLNHYAQGLGYDYDFNGLLASYGDIHQELLQSLNAMDYYRQKPPKSLGIEWVQQQVLPVMERFTISTLDKLATFTEHAAMQVAFTFSKPSAKVLCTGGGVFNNHFISRLKQYTEARLIIPDQVLIAYKEALVFALLGVLKIHDEINCLASVTGAKCDHSSGVIYYP